MSRTTHRMLAMSAIVALAGFGATGATAAAGGPLVRSSGPLTDLRPAAAGPFDGARAAVQIVSSGGASSHTVLRVRGVEGAEGQTFGAHLHVGPCVAGNGAAAGPHYNADALAGAEKPRVGEETEVWLDVTIDDGSGTATASVPFVPVPGDHSVVVHALETNHETGLAGDRLACLPVEW